jgi:tetratricopeptide (TPR) repeat protein
MTTTMSHAPGPPTPPRLPERYELGPLLGQGGMGHVWEARDGVLDVPVAVKVLRPSVAARPGFGLRFHREVALQARLHHPNLVPLHDAGRTRDGIPFVAMALANLGSLARYLPSGLPWAQASKLVDELLAALGALHARGVVHLDIKPENVLLHMGLDQRPHVWLADLGIARLMAEPGQGVRPAMGTPAFMAPEQRAGRTAELDRRSDLYAVGRILAQLVGAYDAPTGLASLLLGLAHPERLCRPALAADVRQALAELGAATAPLPPLPQALIPRAVTTWVTELGVPLEVLPPPPLPAELEWTPWPERVPPPLPQDPPEETSGEASLRASIELYAHREIPIVGRSAEREALWALAHSTRASGQPGVAIITGEAGAGKTRLVRSVVRALEEGGWAEALPVRYQRGAPAASGLQGAALQLIAPWGEDEHQTRDRLERWFQRLLPGVPAGPLARMGAKAVHRPGQATDGSASWHTQLVQWVLHTRCRRGLTVLVVEDAHLSEEPAEGLDIPLQLLNRAELGQPAPVLIICTVRSEALASDLELGRRVALLCSRGAQRLDLPRLGRDAMEQLLAASLDLTPELRRTVASRCEGNPLLARMLITSWAAQGMLQEVGDLMYTLAPGVAPASAIPDDARSLFLKRAHDAADAAGDREAFLRSLTLLALAGRDLPEMMFELLAGDQARELRASGLVQLAEARCRFDHQLLREVLRDASGLRDDLRQLHAQVAQAWVRFGQASGEDVSVPRAEALLEAGHAREAFAPLAQAAASAWRRGRSGATVSRGEAALRALEQAGLDDTHPGAAHAMAVTAAALAEHPDLARAEPLARRALEAAGSVEERALAGAVMGRVATLRGDWAHAHRLLTVLVSELEGAAPRAAALPLEALASGALCFGEHDLAIDSAGRALRASAETPPAARARLVRLVAEAHRREGRLEAAVAAAERALSLAGTGDSDLERALAHQVLGAVLWDRSDHPRALPHLHQAAAALASVRGGGWSQEAQHALAEAHRRMDRREEARRLLSAVAQWGRLRRIPSEAVGALASLCMVEHEDGDAQAAARAGAAAVHAAREQTPSPWMTARLTASDALAAARQERWGQALDLVDRLRNRDVRPRDRDSIWLFEQLAAEARRHRQDDVARWLQRRAEEGGALAAT